MSSSGENCTDKTRLTPKQQLFCDYYLQSGNATESAIKAGYSKKTARFVGSENLTKHNIKEYIKKYQDEQKSSRIADINEIKEFWTNLLRSDQYEPKDRIKASELLGKTAGAFLDKQEIKITTSSLAEELRKLTPEELEEVIKNV